MKQNEKPQRFSKYKIARLVEINDCSAHALQALVRMCTRMRVKHNPKRYLGDSVQHSALDFTFDIRTNEQLIVTIYGHDNFDVRMEATMRESDRYTIESDDSITLHPSLVDERYVLSHAKVRGLSNTVFSTLVTLNSYVVRIGQAEVKPIGDLPLTRSMFDNVPSVIKHEAKENPFRPQVKIGTTNAEFRKLLLRCKDKSFCLSAHNNEIGIFTYGDDNPVYSFKVNDTYSSHYWAGAEYQTIFNSLYRRSTDDKGLLNRLVMGDTDITEYGIIDNRIYVKVEQQELAIYLMFNGFTPIDFTDYKLTIPEKLRLRRGYKNERWQVDKPILEETDEESAVSEPTALTTLEWTTEEEARIQQWRATHEAYCIARDKPSSESIQKWFSDYSMLLIRNGDSPDDLDFNIMSKV